MFLQTLISLCEEGSSRLFCSVRTFVQTVELRSRESFCRQFSLSSIKVASLAPGPLGTRRGLLPGGIVRHGSPSSLPISSGLGSLFPQAKGPGSLHPLLSSRPCVAEWRGFPEARRGCPAQPASTHSPAPSWPQPAKNPDVSTTPTATRPAGARAVLPSRASQREAAQGRGGASKGEEDVWRLQTSRDLLSQLMLLTCSTDGRLAPVQLSK